MLTLALVVSEVAPAGFGLEVPPPDFLLGPDAAGLEVVLPVLFGALDLDGADFVSGFFAGCDVPPAPVPPEATALRPGAAVISAFSANSLTYRKLVKNLKM